MIKITTGNTYLKDKIFRKQNLYYNTLPKMVFNKNSFISIGNIFKLENFFDRIDYFINIKFKNNV